MLEAVLDYIHNYFIHDRLRGKFTILNGALPVVLKEGQYFKIVGSVFNDGVHQYPASDLKDEEFQGEIWAMAVPQSVIALAGDIESWMEKYGESANSPFQSESFGGYSYSKSSGNSESEHPGDWRSVFGSRLNAWRKIS